ncbi:DUF1993 domain-containing protein [Methylobacterium platani]|uniref:DUF1993 domain-containing protein n=2 Tax=Methylobacterium platani TaxID=427683 RepID=A0A179SGN7_9HYPH|nr:DUF1993 domain-containing protein [Methylobacterium platani]KMO19295.1 hypothetical protein SQ03_08245 [Methylobacterium platani JCM 14648]OAS26157.1 hypothetical protein A5481_07360 [Methylobacterium platani]
MSLTQQLVPAYAQMLRALSGWLDKARAHHGAEADDLMSRRLAPDMLPLSSQVRFACLQAREATYRLRGEPLPQALDDLARAGREAGGRPGSLAEAQACIAEALARLDGLEPHALDAGAAAPVTIELPGLTFDMTGESYARDWALPQFSFHLVTAYAILRHQGIPLGKADYVPHMFGYLRTGSPPRT